MWMQLSKCIPCNLVFLHISTVSVVSHSQIVFCYFIYLMRWSLARPSFERIFRPIDGLIFIKFEPSQMGFTKNGQTFDINKIAKPNWLSFSDQNFSSQIYTCSQKILKNWHTYCTSVCFITTLAKCLKISSCFRIRW